MTAGETRILGIGKKGFIAQLRARGIELTEVWRLLYRNNKENWCPYFDGENMSHFCNGVYK